MCRGRGEGRQLLLLLYVVTAGSSFCLKCAEMCGWLPGSCLEAASPGGGMVGQWLPACQDEALAGLLGSSLCFSRP
jgi:hypothetical protein